MSESFATEEALSRLEAKVDEILLQTLPRMPWPIAAILGLILSFTLDNAFKNWDIPYVSPVYEQITDYIGNNSSTWVVMVDDFINGIDRTEPDVMASDAIRGLDKLQTCRLMVTMRARESSHNYQEINDYGYLGGYQAGASALATIGLVRMDAVKSAHARVRKGLNPQHSAFLRNDANWVSGNYLTFLNNPRLQDWFFIQLANANVREGFRAKALIKTDPVRIAGYIAAAHLKGSGAANSWYLRGKDSRDGNQTRTSSYAKLGEQAINKRTKLCGDNSLMDGVWEYLNK